MHLKFLCATVFKSQSLAQRPKAGFEDTIRLHFLHRRDALLETVAAWLAEAKDTVHGGSSGVPAGHAQRLSQLIGQLTPLLRKLK